MDRLRIWHRGRTPNWWNQAPGPQQAFRADHDPGLRTSTAGPGRAHAFTDVSTSPGL